MVCLPSCRPSYGYCTCSVDCIPWKHLCTLWSKRGVWMLTWFKHKTRKIPMHNHSSEFWILLNQDIYTCKSTPLRLFKYVIYKILTSLTFLWQSWKVNVDLIIISNAKKTNRKLFDTQLAILAHCHYSSHENSNLYMLVFCQQQHSLWFGCNVLTCREVLNS